MLRAAIQSIVDQTMEKWEMIIVDDGSSDSTPVILADYANRDARIRVIRNDKNIRIVKSLNKGMTECKAPLIARMDADDFSTVTRLEIQKKFMDERPNTAMCGSGMFVINHEGKLEREVRHPCSAPLIVNFIKNTGCPFVHGSVMFRKSVIIGLGGYSEDPRFEYAEDYELWERMAANHQVMENIPERSLYFHRNHCNTSSKIYSQQQERATQAIMSIARQQL
jgi:glycosyltransferase involved in cell wall biosynthesis